MVRENCFDELFESALVGHVYKRQRELCRDAEEKLQRYIQQGIEDSERRQLNDKH